MTESIAERLRSIAAELEDSQQRIEIKQDITLREALAELGPLSEIVHVSVELKRDVNHDGKVRFSHEFKVWDGDAFQYGPALGALVVQAKARLIGRRQANSKDNNEHSLAAVAIAEPAGELPL